MIYLYASMVNCFFRNKAKDSAVHFGGYGDVAVLAGFAECRFLNEIEPHEFDGRFGRGE
jgi:hypothetical protein